MVTKGTVVKVVRGVKVPRGTVGVVFWVGDTKFGARVGFKDDAGEVFWTAAGNVEALEAVPVVAPAKVASLAEMAGALDAGARMAALEARVAALEAALFAADAAPAPFIPDGVDPLEVRAFTN